MKMTFNSDSDNQEPSWLLALKKFQLLSEKQEAFDYVRRHFMEVCSRYPLLIYIRYFY